MLWYFDGAVACTILYAVVHVDSCECVLYGRVTSHQTKVLQNTSQFHWTKLKISVSTVNSKLSFTALFLRLLTVHYFDSCSKGVSSVLIFSVNIFNFFVLFGWLSWFLFLCKLNDAINDVIQLECAPLFHGFNVLTCKMRLQWIVVVVSIGCCCWYHR